MRRLPVQRLDIPAKVPTDLYFIETECAERHIKIGVASNVRTRMNNMRINCPYKLRLIKRVAGAAHLEQVFHAQFAKDRLIGEWFRRSPELLQAIALLDGVDYLEGDEPRPTVDAWSLMPDMSDPRWAEA